MQQDETCKTDWYASSFVLIVEHRKFKYSYMKGQACQESLCLGFMTIQSVIKIKLQCAFESWCYAGTNSTMKTTCTNC